MPGLAAGNIDTKSETDMKLFLAMRRAVLAILLLGLAGSGALAAEIQVITSGAFAAALAQLVPAYEKQSTHKVVVSNGASMGTAPDSIPSRLGRGEKFDILILARPALDGFADKGQVDPASRVDLAASTIGAAVRKGTPRPDISTVDALRKTLLAAKSIAYSASASGTYLSTELFPKLGVAEQLKDTAKKIYSERVGTVVARGDAELGFQQVSELLPIEGLEFLGEIPAEVQQTVFFSAGITKDAQNPEAARDLIRFLTSAEAAPIIRKTGMNPVAGK